MSKNGCHFDMGGAGVNKLTTTSEPIDPSSAGYTVGTPHGEPVDSQSNVMIMPAAIDVTPPATVARLQKNDASSAGVIATPYMV
ncbi:hypothetical protein GF420_04775 [candidate division GN15 bacterium]|nr:hypothetical protein [candidate division GN15 bacterium]